MFLSKLFKMFSIMNWFYLLLISIFMNFVNSNVMAQNESCFEKTLNEITLKLVYNQVDEMDLYSLLAIKNDKDTIVLDQYNRPQAQLFGLLNKEEQEQFNVIDATLKNNTVYCLYYNMGTINLINYEIIDNTQASKKEYFIDRNQQVSYHNSGGTFYDVLLNWINEDLYIYIDAGQNHGGKTKGLYKFSPLHQEICLIEFEEVSKVKDEKLMMRTPEIKKGIVFEEIKKILQEYNKSVNLKESEILEFFDDFSAIDDIENSNVRDIGITYFFYQEEVLGPTKIIRYDNYRNLWLIGNFTEQPIEKPISNF